MRNHEETLTWVSHFCSAHGKAVTTVLTEEEFKLAKFFITSNLGLSQLANPCFADILDKSIKNPTYHRFRNKVLPEIMAKFHDAVDAKLKKAISICMIVDIWTNRVNADYLAVGARITDYKFNSELIVVGMERMKGGHNAENVAITIESIINSYNFDKNKIHGI